MVAGRRSARCDVRRSAGRRRCHPGRVGRDRRAGRGRRWRERRSARATGRCSAASAAGRRLAAEPRSRRLPCRTPGRRPGDRCRRPVAVARRAAAPRRDRASTGGPSVPRQAQHQLVVDQADVVDPDGEREQRAPVDLVQLGQRVRVGDRDVVQRRRRLRRPAPRSIAPRTASPDRSPAANACRARQERPVEHGRRRPARPAYSRALRDDIARPSGSRTVAQGTTSVGSARSSAIRRITATCW